MKGWGLHQSHLEKVCRIKNEMQFSILATFGGDGKRSKGLWLSTNIFQKVLQKWSTIQQRYKQYRES